MGDTTDELLDLAHEVTPIPAPRELDMLLSAGERISMALLAMAIKSMGHEARSFTGSQAGMITDATHGAARIVDVTPVRLREALDDGAIVIVAGFQGFNRDTRDITTLGRGGSDTTAVALAAALDADVCEIYTDVDGVFTSDPRVVKKARKLDRITSEEMLELAASGAKVLHIRAVEYARRHGVTLHVRSSFNNNEGTIVYDPSRLPEGATVEESVIAGVAVDLTEAKITVVGVPDVPGVAAKIFKIVANTERERRHDRAERVGRVDRAHRHLVHAPEVRGRAGAHRARERAGGRRASCRCSTTTRSASSRSSAPPCARRRASRRGCSRRCTTRASTSR